MDSMFSGQAVIIGTNNIIAFDSESRWSKCPPIGIGLWRIGIGHYV